MPYHTMQQAVLHCLEQRREESLSAVELAEELRRLGCAVGLATIYRQLEKLAAVGQIHRIDTAEGTLSAMRPRRRQPPGLLFAQMQPLRPHPPSGLLPSKGAVRPFGAGPSFSH